MRAKWNLEYELTNDPQFLAQLSLGREVDEWFRSSLGQYVIGCAKQEVEAALRELVVADPFDAERIKFLQDKINRATDALNWLMELFEAKRNLEAQADFDMEQRKE